MKLSIRSRHFDLAPELHDQITRRVHFALSRLDGSIQAVDITIADINGPRGGADKQCQIRVRGPALKTIVIEHLGLDSLATVSLALDRAARAVLRRVARRRAFASSTSA